MGEIIIKEIDFDKFAEEYPEKYRPISFAEHMEAYGKDIYSEEEQDKLTKIKDKVKDRYRIAFGAFDGDKMVGWSIGDQDNQGRFYMGNSAVLKEHRKQGIYTKLLDKVVTTAISKGFREVYSLHLTTNNAVIIPNLKYGFVITGMDIRSSLGTTVQLSYIANDLQKEVLKVRSGECRPTKEIKKILEI